MSTNIKNLINKNKIKTNSGDTSFNVDTGEQTVYPDDDASTLVGGESYNEEIEKKEYVKKNIFKENNNKFQEVKDKLNEYEDYDKDDEQLNEDVKAFDQEYFSKNDDLKEKYKLLRKFDRFRKKGYQDIQDLKLDDDIELYHAVHDNLKYVIKKDRAIKMMRHLLWIFTWLFELFISKMGYGARFTGFARYLWKHADNYEEYFEDMVSDKFVIDKRTKTVHRIENKSVVAKMNVSPVVNLAFAWMMDAIQFSAVNHASLFTSVFKDHAEGKISDELNDEEHVFAQAPVPEPEESDDEDDS
jgi:hypothetical protein